ncbi:hypothetical protein Clacol_000422 [Clathrus columnatus]|uniref:Uncharacterized protein n=1 Tax=Clathrus columnatus TaxID=1419009 RepID=A0AAV4ZYF0_9AGAM|nr:hypothetical protein Clacol_000422 [Clathrus columnatus]
MPLFGSKRDSSEDYDQQFHPGPTAGNGQNGNTSRFARRSGSIGSHTSGGSSDVHNDTGSRRGSLLTKFRSNNSLSNSPNTNAFAHDPAIKAARQKVTDAEHAESDADRALEMARGAVREARQHVKDLEAAAIQDTEGLLEAQESTKSSKKASDDEIIGTEPGGGGFGWLAPSGNFVKFVTLPRILQGLVQGPKIMSL